jgi:serine/threonine protein kinase
MRHDVLSRLDDQLPALLKECPDCGRCYDGSVERCLADEALLVFTLPVGRTVDDRYRLDRLLGKGGMGAVYEARDLRLERSVAIKILLARGLRRAGTLRRFRREARATARLSHPNIVTIYDFGSLEEEMAYIVMERVHGETLRLRLEREGRLRSAALREWFEPMLSGIAAAHANGIVHRDLKPENVMGARNSAGALDVKILDLGLAKLRAQEQQEPETMTQEGLVMGTPDYMSPEQLLGREVDQRSDLFAVGVMLLEALTGRRIRRGDLRSRKLLEIDLSAYELAPAWLELVGRCLAPDPEDRPPSAEALSATLLRCCS